MIWKLKIGNWKFNVKPNQGFTLIEMLVYMGLLSIFLLILTQVFTSSLDAQLESQATSTVEQDTRFIFTRLAHDIENADNLVSPAALGEESSNLVLTRSGETFTYSLQNSNLVLDDTLSIDSLNSYATEVTALNFERLGNTGGKNNIKVTLTVQSKTLRSGNTETKTFETTLGTR